MTAATATAQITVGEHISRADFEWITAAQYGTPSSQIDKRDDIANDSVLSDAVRATDSITVIDSAGRRLALCTDTHRLHAVAVTNRLRRGVYTTTTGYQLDDQLTHRSTYIAQVTSILDRLQTGAPTHSIRIRISERRSSELRHAVEQHDRCVVALRTRAITVHDPDTDELLHRIGGTAAFGDRLRRDKLIVVAGAALHRILVSDIRHFTGTGALSPIIGHHRERLAVIMPIRPSVAVSTMWGTDGEPVST